MNTDRETPRNGHEQAAALDIDFEKLGGLVTTVVQEAETGEVLMLAYMNKEALDATLQTGYAHYYSRSRKRLWKKGEESGNVQELRELRVDCDQDAVLLKVRQHGAGACHTGNPTCFYRRYRRGELIYDPLPRSSV